MKAVNGTPSAHEEKRDPMRELFPLPPTLRGDRLLLRPLEASDAADLLRLTRQEKVYRYLPTYLFEKQNEAAILTLYSGLSSRSRPLRSLSM